MEPVPDNVSLIDILIITVYMIATVAIGISAKGRQSGANDYFTAAGGMSGAFASILVGLSIASTFFSGISFIAVPGIVYREGIGLVFALLCLPVCWLVLRLWFLPRYLSMAEGEPYAFLAKRLAPGVRTQVAILYILLRLGWMATLIYAPTLAILELMHLDAAWLPLLIVLLGAVSTLYTVFGGLRGVIVTDALQFVVIAVGILITIIVILYKLPVSLSEGMGVLQESAIVQWPTASLNPTQFYTWWSIAFGFGASYLATYIADQMSLQRYLAAKTPEAANRSFAFNIVGVILVLLLLIAVGLCLRVWYHYNPVEELASNTDRVFPYFVTHELPVGLSGLIIAVLLAATMSSITSGINALASVITIDIWHGVLRTREADGAQLLKTSRRCSLALGIFCTFLALFVERLGALFDVTQALLGLFLGPILAAVCLAIWGYRISAKSFLLAVICAVLLGSLALTYVASVWTTFITTTLCLLVCCILGPHGGRHRMAGP